MGSRFELTGGSGVCNLSIQPPVAFVICTYGVYALDRLLNINAAR